jgi:hypothetical protein
VEIARVFYAGDARRFMVFSAMRHTLDPSSASSTSTSTSTTTTGTASLPPPPTAAATRQPPPHQQATWQVVDSRDVDLPPMPPPSDALVVGAGRMQFRVQTQELHPPLRVQPGT